MSRIQRHACSTGTAPIFYTTDCWRLLRFSHLTENASLAEFKRIEPLIKKSGISRPLDGIF